MDPAGCQGVQGAADSDNGSEQALSKSKVQSKRKRLLSDSVRLKETLRKMEGFDILDDASPRSITYSFPRTKFKNMKRIFFHKGWL